MSTDGSSSITYLLCFVVFCIGFGVLMIFARDFMWELTAWGNQWKGVRSERTEQWEIGQVIGGVVFILIGAGLGCWGITQMNQLNQQQAAIDALETSVAATRSSGWTRLQSIFSEYIPRWEADDSPGVKRVSVAGVRADAIYYGRCTGGNFYVIVREFEGQSGGDFAYVPEDSPDRCRPPGLLMAYIGSPAALGGGWWSIEINMFTEDSDIITPTPSRTAQPTPTRASPTPNATQLQLTIEAAVQQQLTQAAPTQDLSVTQTIGAAVQGTLTAAAP